MSSIVKFLALNSGSKMPTVGLGTFLMQNEALKVALDYALFIGYRHIDTALGYGNEKEIGEVIASRINSGKLKRNDLFVTTKIPSVYLEYKDAIKSCEESLDNLKFKSVDMLLIHHPCGNVNRGDGVLKPVNAKGERETCSYDTRETWKAMEKLVAENKTKNIGLSNFQPSGIKRILEMAKIKPSNLQLECHAYLQQNELRKLCTEHGIVLTAYAAMGASGKKQERDIPVLINDSVIKEIADSINKTPAEILLNFVAKLGNTGVLPKSQTKSRLEQNLGITNWELSLEDFNKIKSLDQNVKYFDFDWANTHPDFYPGEPY